MIIREFDSEKIPSYKDGIYPLGKYKYGLVNPIETEFLCPKCLDGKAEFWGFKLRCCNPKCWFEQSFVKDWDNVTGK